MLNIPTIMIEISLEGDMVVSVYSINFDLDISTMSLRYLEIPVLVASWAVRQSNIERNLDRRSDRITETDIRTTRPRSSIRLKVLDQSYRSLRQVSIATFLSVDNWVYGA